MAGVSVLAPFLVAPKPGESRECRLVRQIKQIHEKQQIVRSNADFPDIRLCQRMLVRTCQQRRVPWQQL